MSIKYNLHENGTIILTPVFDRVVPDKSNGRKHKKYTIDRRTFRRIASSAVNLWDCRKHKVTFFTLTFPFNPTERQANECFSKFVENLKQNYGLKNYLATKERGENGEKHLHFHCVFDLPYKDIKSINKAWCNTFRLYAPFSPRAVIIPKRSNGGAVIQSQERCIKYICKYVSKSVNVEFEQPCVFISRQIVSKPRELMPFECTMLQNTFENTEYVHDYFTIIQLKNGYISKFFKFPTKNSHELL